MNSDSPKDQDERNVASGSSSPDNNDAVRHGLARLSTSWEDSETEDPPKGTRMSTDDEEQEHDEPAADEPSAKPRIYRINTLNKDGDSVDDEEDDEEGSNIRPDELFDIVFNLDTPLDIDLKVSIQGEFNVTILYDRSDKFMEDMKLTFEQGLMRDVVDECSSHPFENVRLPHGPYA
ncbi:hypothetical protein BJY01DRAFT_246795 [Aspergillus pseudoustus]|uniref:Uncharacterized protein n=1 Tax=Aspergillus pseudoustus TaxID=1810923 RepID=A0ABR4K532_9EURO